MYKSTNIRNIEIMIPQVNDIWYVNLNYWDMESFALVKSYDDSWITAIDMITGNVVDYWLTKSYRKLYT
jgi:hypothetical protein